MLYTCVLNMANWIHLKKRRNPERHEGNLTKRWKKKTCCDKIIETLKMYSLTEKKTMEQHFRPCVSQTKTLRPVGAAASGNIAPAYLFPCKHSFLEFKNKSPLRRVDDVEMDRYGVLIENHWRDVQVRKDWPLVEWDFSWRLPIKANRCKWIPL